MRSFWKSVMIGLLIGLGLVVIFANRAGAQTDVGLISGTPLKIQIFPNNSLQVWHNRYTEGASFGTAGSGFFIALNTNIYGPFYVDMEFVSQTPTEGQGTAADPFRSVLHQRLVSGETTLEVTQTALYVNNSPSFQLEWQIANTGSANACFKAYHGADLYFANDDRGSGYYNATTGSVGGYNQAKDWYMVFTPLTPASHYEEAGYRTIWNRLQNMEDLNDTIDNNYIDNGAALQWDICLAGGQSKTISDLWSFGESEAAIVAAVGQPASPSSVSSVVIPGPLGLSAQHYREVAPGSPTLTTTIPTPLDITLTPAVVGTNLLWAALASILFTIASEVFNRTLADYEAFFQRLFNPLKPVGNWGKKTGLAGRLGRPVWYERLKLVLIVIIYGLIFSFLDNTWKPFSLNGIWLFITMAIAFGVVGLADDITEWNTARRWKLPTRISIRPGNLVLAFVSMLFSRTLVLTPGVMFGMPEAFEIDPDSLNNQRRNRLLTLAAGVMLAILFGSWLPTISEYVGPQSGDRVARAGAALRARAGGGVAKPAAVDFRGDSPEPLPAYAGAARNDRRDDQGLEPYRLVLCAAAGIVYLSTNPVEPERRSGTLAADQQYPRFHWHHRSLPGVCIDLKRSAEAAETQRDRKARFSARRGRVCFPTNQRCDYPRQPGGRCPAHGQQDGAPGGRAGFATYDEYLYDRGCAEPAGELEHGFTKRAPGATAARGGVWPAGGGAAAGLPEQPGPCHPPGSGGGGGGAG